MKKNDISTSAFLERLTAVYGSAEATFQQVRYAKLAESFEKDFSENADLRFFSAPGRTEVGGNHTDHNNGKVLAAAINLDAVAAVSPREDSIICVNSEGYPSISVDIDDLKKIIAKKIEKRDLFVFGTNHLIDEFCNDYEKKYNRCYHYLSDEKFLIELLLK